ncbi:class I SAM-dependent methyltransferase [Salibacterium halotolerans]|uniref:Methyltransferase domain-containing protein n=1 Tax=Salibacterium halotolerans TaxID=1884432 RepID=A0A1I5UPR6_9BACI|nr:class I SAM-dependent methyltransferase [Salibacterium halotolerans]SFP97229.1 Methyltransferase domain-containing protein [Salibacterium halotolerans]
MSTLFSKIYDPIMRPFEKKRLGNLRERLISHQEGTILEVGSGTGTNFSYYKNAEKVVAIEPNASMRNQSLSKMKRADVPVELVDASGEHLPFDDNTFDAAIGTLVLCTIPNPNRALQEIRRVCIPGVPILFIEHVRVDRPFPGRIQDWLTPFWKRLSDGCHLNRNTLNLIKQNGFQVERIEKYYKDILLVVEAKNGK